MRKEAKEKARGIINAIREVSAYGIGAGAVSSAFFAGVLIIITVVIGMAAYSDSGSYFGARQWSIIMSLMIVGILSLVMYLALTKKCGGLMTEDVNKNADDASEPDEDDADDESAEVTLLGVLAESTLTCITFCAWFFVMGSFCYAAGEMDAAGFSVAEVTAIETLAAIVLGVVLNRFCKRETR